MCGVTGLLSPELSGEAMHAAIAAMTGALAHRGPDDGDLWQEDASHIAFGHRRLSIIDLSPMGRQPMHSDSGRYTLTYNGEIYNFLELRRDLETQGTRFRGNSDSEVLLAAIEAWGVAATLPKLNGMFAFAIWDKAERSLTLARDPLGIKPLHWAALPGGGFAFASEPRAILKAPGFAPRLNRGSLGLFLRYNYVPAPLSIWQGLNKLPPGSLLILRSGETPREERYWSALDAAHRQPRIQHPEEAEAALSELLERSVKGCMIADVPLGAFLSGGIDSSLVAALMQQASSRPVKTFTIGYAEAGYDESDAAAAVARHIGTDHTELTVTPEEAMGVIPQLPALYDEPFADASQIPTYLVSKLTRRHVTVALSGDGGDEGFAGYNRHAMALRWQQWQSWPGGLRHMLASLCTILPPGQWDTLMRMMPQRIRVPQFGEKLAKLGSALNAGSILDYYRPLTEQWPDAAALLGMPVEPLKLSPMAGGENIVSYLQRLDLDGYLHDDVLTKVDRASMAVGLEARVPLLDHHVVALGLSLPTALKTDGRRGKLILRRLLARYVPPELTERPKSGFAVPIAEWLRGPMRDWAEDLLSPAALKETGLLEAAPIRAAWAAHLARRENRQYGLWGVLMFQAWQRHWRPSL